MNSHQKAFGKQNGSIRSGNSTSNTTPPPPYPPVCCGCADAHVLASVWCCECSQSLCAACDVQRHNVGTNEANKIALDNVGRPMCSHRVEIIVDGGGISLLTPLLEVVVLFWGLATLRPLMNAAGRALSVDYFFDSICPVVSRVRRIVFRIDHALYPVLRSPLDAWCNSEDAFLKIFADVWVRGVLTSTDSYALMIMKTPAAMGAFVLVMALIPFIAVPYAVVATILRMIELVFLPNWAIFRRVAVLVRHVNSLILFPCWISSWVCRLTILGYVIDYDVGETFHHQIRRKPIPPKTGGRLRPRPSHGMRDISAFGSISRITRIFTYFNKRAQKAITSAILTSVFMAFSTRIILLYSPRCGDKQGIFTSSYPIQKICWDFVDAIEGGEYENPPQCMSVHHVSRKLAKRIGVEIPDLDDLGDDAAILKSLQEASGNDFIDETLRRLLRGAYRYIGTLDFHVKVGLCVLTALVLLSGMLRQLVYWADLHRRRRWVEKTTASPDSTITVEEVETQE